MSVHRATVRNQESVPGLPLLLVGQRGNRRAQPVDGQILVAAHRRDAIRSR